MPREDDPELSGNLLLYRRIPDKGGRVKWDTGGQPAATKSNFQDQHEELSLYIAGETTPQKALAGHEGFGLVQVTAEQIRQNCPGVIICRDDELPADGHILVCGRVTDAMAKKLSRACVWVDGCLPSQEPPAQTEGAPAT